MAATAVLFPPLPIPPRSAASTSNPNPNPRSNRTLSLSFIPPPRRGAAVAAARQTSRKSKNRLKAKESVKNLPPLDPSSSAAAAAFPPLLPNQAVGLVAAAQANFMRVIVESTPGSPAARAGTELLCVVRALMKKMRRRVMVGDKVLVGSVDWVDGRGMIEDVFGRRTEILDPPVANVDRLVVFFSMEQPRPEPFTLTRFLIEAESTGIPLTLVFNKAELVGDEVRMLLTSIQFNFNFILFWYKMKFLRLQHKIGEL